MIRYFVLLILVTGGFACAGWHDPIRGFDIDIPTGWSVHEENIDKTRNLILLNRDESIGVGVMSIEAGRVLAIEQWIELVEPIFLSNILSGGKRISIGDHVQNGIVGKYAIYRGPYTTRSGVIRAEAHAFYTERKGVGYIVWCVVPSALSSSHLPRAKRVVASFSFGRRVGAGDGALSVVSSRTKKKADDETADRRARRGGKIYARRMGSRIENDNHSYSRNAADLKRVAKARFEYDLEGNGRKETILVVPFKKAEEGEFCYLVVLDENGNIVWSGPRKADAENPMVFGEWDYGISMPEVIGDIDADGMIELIAPDPQSDVSPTAFRVLRWIDGAFRHARTSVLMERPPASGNFVWGDAESYQGVWISGFKSIRPDGDLEVEITRYYDGYDTKIKNAIVSRAVGGFVLKRWIDSPVSNESSPDLYSGASKRYRARLGRADHFNSIGVKLTDVASILRQDRANYYRYGIRDPEDESDTLFATAASRASIPLMRIKCFDRDWKRRIIYGTPLVEVRVDSGELILSIVRD